MRWERLAAAWLGSGQCFGPREGASSILVSGGPFVDTYLVQFQHSSHTGRFFFRPAPIQNIAGNSIEVAPSQNDSQGFTAHSVDEDSRRPGVLLGDVSSVVLGLVHGH